MIEIQERVPNYIDLGPDFVFPTFTVATLEELLELGFVKRWMSSPNFSHWSYAPPGYFTKEHLMANMTDGKFWATSRVHSGSLAEFGLPMWKDR